MANFAYDDEFPDVITDEDGKVIPPKRRPIGKEHLLDAGDALPQVMLEGALTKKELREVVNTESYAFVMQVPNESWVLPMHAAAKSLAHWDDSIFHGGAKSLSSESSRKIVRSLSTGCRVLATSQNIRLLPTALLHAADRTAVIPQPSPELIAKAIKLVTGRLPIDVPAKLGAGLNFDELISCMRRGSSAAECVDRIKSAQARKMGAYDHDVPDLEDLHGYGDAMIWAKDLVVDLEAWRRGEIEWSALSAAVVLASAPGLGKTSMMRSLAKSLGVPLIATSVASWFSQGSGYLDAIVRQVDTLFSEAKAQSPCLLFLDEIDALPSRETIDGRNADYWNVLITRILTLLDGAVGGQTEGIILVGATNFADRLDPALVRPGRFGMVINIEPPDEAALKGILRQHLGNDLMGQDLTAPAQLSMGATGARVSDYVKNARRSARKQKRDMVMADLVDAIAPWDNRPASVIERVAVHEAGHAVLAEILDVAEVTTISIIQRGDAGGFVAAEMAPYAPMRRDVENIVIQLLAGRAAEDVILGEVSTGSGGSPDSDLATATRCIASLHLSSGLGDDFIYMSSPEEVPFALARNPRKAAEVEDELRKLYAEALRLVRIHADKIVAVSEELMAHRQLNRAQFLAAMHSVKAPRDWKVSENG